MNFDEPYFNSYRDVLVHKMMLTDVVRTEAYERALQQVVKPGLKVMDFGCGTGVLSIFASRYGAEQVYAVDRSAFIKVACDIVKANHIDNISFCHADHKNLDLPERMDVIVSEWMGHFIFYEAMLGPLLEVRDRFLAEGGIMIPDQVTLHVGFVCDESLFEELSFFRQNPYGIDFSPIADAPMFQTSLEFFTPKQILPQTVSLGTFDLYTLKTPPQLLTATAIPKKRATIYGLCGWFSARLADGIHLATGPDDPPTHWNQMFFPFPEPFEMSPEREITIRIAPPEDDEMMEYAWCWSISDGKQDVHMNDYHRVDELDPKGPDIVS